jgi:hypothetical protein
LDHNIWYQALIIGFLFFNQVILEFSWIEVETKDFENLKEAMCTTPILATPDVTKTFIVECDA